MRPRSYSRGLRNRKTYANANANTKLLPFESLGAVSYSPSIVTVAVSVAVCEIFSVKKWRDLENQVRGSFRVIENAPFDRPYAIFYWSVIVNIALTCTIFSGGSSKNTLEGRAPECRVGSQ